MTLHYCLSCGKFGPPYLGKATAAARTSLPSPTSACWVFSFFYNPPNTDMDYRIFKYAYVIIIVHAYIYIRGLHGHTDSESAQQF